ncbi:MAG: methionyl-tRNA formyltransferase, partial [Opitutales bacterium]|nr:methionyl-tRNA formyltransferase [Opitutales bacterium]
MNELKKVVFFGSDAIALPVLETLISAPLRALVRIEAIYTQPDRPSGRGQKIQPNAIAQWARDFNIPLYQPEKLGAEDVARIREIGCDIGLVMAYGHILKQDMLDAPKLGF